MTAAAFIVLGYLSGSVLYAKVFEKLLNKKDMIQNSKDKNPGTANAFVHGGFLCGTLTLICDVLKGALPVYIYTLVCPDLKLFAFVIAAPVIGHIFSVFYKFKGGKGIAVTFGCLFGLMPLWQPFAALALCFIFFSLIVRITPHFHRTVCAYLCALAVITLISRNTAAILGYGIITAAVCVRMLLSKEEKEKLKVKLLWMH